jgi:hypothetical protein
MTKIIRGFKGYDKNLKCRDFQYEIGKEYQMEGEPKACEQGFHFCENPLDVWNYYPPTNGNRFTEVETDGKIDKEDSDSKVASDKLKVGLELGFKGMIEGFVKFIFEKTKSSKETLSTTGYKANAATTGNYANAATTGNYANAATTGYKANAATTGENTVSAAIGIKGAAKASIGSWIVVSEWVQDEHYKWLIKEVKTAKIDGTVLKSDTFYKLENGKFVVCE